MAPDAGEFVIRSNIRPGLKREFMFAFHSHAQLFDLPRSRNRSSKIERKPEMSNPDTMASSNISANSRETFLETVTLCTINPQEPMMRNPTLVPEKSNPPSFHHHYSLTIPSPQDKPTVSTSEPYVVHMLRGTMPKRNLVPMDELSCSTSTCSVKNDVAGINMTELQMFKNILLSKLPSTAREFLATGLLNGSNVKYVNYKSKPKGLQGMVKDGGILCFCASCKGSTVVTPYQFELHAGSKKKHPWDYIFLENGKSIRQAFKDWIIVPLEMFDYAVKNAMAMRRAKKLLPNKNCKECVCGSDIHQGKLSCKCCRNILQRENSTERINNAHSVNKVTIVDPIPHSQQNSEQHVQVVSMEGPYLGGCVICRCQDFSKSKFGERTVMICDQCEREYHVGCLKAKGMANLEQLPDGEWFCTHYCSRVHDTLQETLLLGSQPIPNQDLDGIKRKCKEKGLNTNGNFDIRWRLLRGKNSNVETKGMLNNAITIFYELFDPILDGVTGRDLIPRMVFGKRNNEQDYAGVYCAVLIVDSSIVTTGIFRVLGHEVAELPLVATRKATQGLGYFKLLFICIERLFVSMKIKHLVLPATEEAEELWTNKFGFARVTPQQQYEYTNCVRPMCFNGTVMLHKLLSDYELSNPPSL